MFQIKKAIRPNPFEARKQNMLALQYMNTSQLQVFGILLRIEFYVSEAKTEAISLT